MPPMGPGSCRTGTNGLARPEPKPCFLLVKSSMVIHTNENGLLDLDRVIHIFIIFKPKDVKLIMIVQLICGTAV